MGIRSLGENRLRYLGGLQPLQWPSLSHLSSPGCQWGQRRSIPRSPPRREVPLGTTQLYWLWIPSTFGW